MRTITIVDAKYIDGLRVEIIFNDKKKKIVDFSSFFQQHSHPQYNKYKKPEQFKKFKVENGNVVWGKDWDMVFPVYDLYNGKIEA